MVREMAKKLSLRRKKNSRLYPSRQILW
jgi:hypothetical protein